MTRYLSSITSRILSASSNLRTGWTLGANWLGANSLLGGAALQRCGTRLLLICGFSRCGELAPRNSNDKRKSSPQWLKPLAQLCCKRSAEALRHPKAERKECGKTAAEVHQQEAVRHQEAGEKRGGKTADVVRYPSVALKRSRVRAVALRHRPTCLNECSWLRQRRRFLRELGC
jgi:hypothetical protein